MLKQECLKWSYRYIASISINSCLLTSLEETLRVQYQTSFLYSQELSLQRKATLLLCFYCYRFFSSTEVSMLTS